MILNQIFYIAAKYVVFKIIEKIHFVAIVKVIIVYNW